MLLASLLLKNSSICDTTAHPECIHRQSQSDINVRESTGSTAKPSATGVKGDGLKLICAAILCVFPTP